MTSETLNSTTNADEPVVEGAIADESAHSVELAIETDDQLRSAIEAICMVADEPVSAQRLAEVFRLEAARVTEACEALSGEYREAGCGFALVNIAGGWRYQSAPSQAGWVEHFVLDGQTSRLSGAALETLAIVAYKQPISRAQIAAIRGVNVDGVLRTLQQRGYITVTGEVEGGGQAQLFGTSALFLEKLGIAGLEDLPPLGDFVPDADLVEILERGLRPSATLDLSEDGDIDLGDQIAQDKSDLTEGLDADGLDDADDDR